jgi:uncharacterized repeat protein (TIGR01451 family)
MTKKYALAIAAGSALLLSFAAAASLSGSGRVGPAQPASSQSSVSAKAHGLEVFHNSPMAFEANQGQTDARVQFLSRGAGYTLFLTEDGAVMKLQNPASAKPASKNASSAVSSLMPYVGSRVPNIPADQNSSEAVLNMRLVAANPNAAGSASNRLPGTSNYFIGNDHSKWRTGVPTFERVRYSNVYPGIDMVYYGNQRELEYDFVVAPGADPNLIGLRLTAGAAGNGKLISNLENNGDLVAHLESGDVRFHRPVVYQLAGSQKQFVDGHYILQANGEVGFALGAYDRTRELVIDPTAAYSTYLGGSNVDIALGVTLDDFGSCFVTGTTLSTDFPLENPLQATNAGEEDIFITKFDAQADAEEYSTYVGGSGNDVASDIRLDNLGDMTVTGYTTSTNFPLEDPIQANFGGGTITGDAFVFQIASHGTALVFSTYLGGASDDQGSSLALDSNNNIYVVGYTSSTNFPVTLGSLSTTCGKTSAGVCSNGFVLKIPASGTSLTYSTYLGGSGGLGDAAYGVAVDSNSDAYVVGITGSPNFPVTSKAYDTKCGTDGKCNGTYDGFVSELNPKGNALVFSTFLGGSSYDYAAGVALDTTGVYVSGNTTSTDFPVTKGAFQTTFGGMSSGCVPSSTTTCGDVTITKLKLNGTGLIYSTYLGGSLDENPGMSMAVDAGGSVYVTGQTDSLNFPVANALLPTFNGGATDAFLTKLNPQGTGLTYSTYLGGSGPDNGIRVALDQFADAFVSGTTTSLNFPTTGGVFQPHCASCGTNMSDAFAFKMTTTADLNVSMKAPATVASGATLSYTITSGNTGPDAASAVVITDTLPTGTTFQSVTTSPGTCTAPAQGATGTVTCNLGSQPEGSRIKITLVVNVTAASGTVITNAASTTAANGNNVEASASTTVN